uniref:LysE family translocator n=1 Tax=Thaumasiovibrio occultus TaxID=1891184 RepID=UPI000B34CDE1|nr:LysE family translocator [Thaumasiovibrio occultus]
MNISLLYAYTFSVLLLLLTPGPVFGLIISSAIQHGSKAAFTVLLGTHIASLYLMALACMILLGLLNLPVTFLNLAGLMGAIYLCFCAVSSLRHQTIGTPATPPLSFNRFTQGFLVGISNPKDILFFVALFPQFINITPHFNSSVLVLSLIWIVLDLAVLSLYIMLCSCNSLQRFHTVFHFCAGLFLLVVSIASGTYYAKELFHPLMSLNR